MTQEEREKAKKVDPNFHLYGGDCIRCDVNTRYLSKENDLCFGCEQDDLEFEESRNETPYELGDKEAEFRHEKSMQGWSDDMDEEIWDKHFRFNS